MHKPGWKVMLVAIDGRLAPPSIVETKEDTYQMTSESKPTMGCRAIHGIISSSTRRISQLPAETLTHESCYYGVLSAVNI